MPSLPTAVCTHLAHRVPKASFEGVLWPSLPTRFRETIE